LAPALRAIPAKLNHIISPSKSRTYTRRAQF